MHTTLIGVHGGLRWLIVLVGLIAFVRHLQGMQGGVPFARARKVGVAFTALMHINLLIGVVLYGVSPLIKGAMADMKGAMRIPDTRFIVAEHPLIMVVAVILVTIGGIVAKNAADDAVRHKKGALFIGAVLALLAYGIPWSRVGG